ncbi:MAG: oxidoreductase [Bacteroidia bacterium]|nr:oxidoreductase [Bacteroidia bacterium]
MANSKWNEQNISDQNGKVVIITGATSGIGKAAAKLLAPKNAQIVMAVRNTQKGEKVAKEILDHNPNALITVSKMDLSSLDSIKEFADDFISNFDRLDVLINNAGVMMSPFARTSDGFELQMGTNHLGHFALTGHLMPILKATKDSRVVATSSMAHMAGNIDFEDFNWEKRKYNPTQAYGDSKIANLYFTYELAKRYKDDPDAPMATAAHPGWTGTELQRHSGAAQFLNNFFAQKPAMGILPSLRAAYDSEAKPGDYYGPSRFFGMHGSPIKINSNKRSHDEEAAKKLWDLSAEMTGVSY